jgi:hypothetical protein
VPTTPRRQTDRGRSAPRDHNPIVPYDLTGTVRWLDRQGRVVVVHVTDCNGHARRFLDHDLTVRLPGDPPPELLEELLPGTAVDVHARMPRELGSRTPEVMDALHVRPVPYPLA